MHYSFQTLQNYYIVQPYIGGEELFYILQRYGRLHPDFVIFYAAQVTLAIEGLHELDIVHGDIRPENIMIDSDGYLVVIDLGLAEKCPEMTRGLTEFKGTLTYMAPEMIPPTRNYGKAIDWWALGILIYELMTGLPPFYDEDNGKKKKKILRGPLVFPEDFDGVAEDFVFKLLDRNPHTRLIKSEKIKKDPFFSKTYWNILMNKDYKPPRIYDLGFNGEELSPARLFGGGDIQLTDDHEFVYFAQEGPPNPNSEYIQGLIDQGQQGEQGQQGQQGQQWRQGGGSISSTKKIGAPYTRERSNAIYL
jgi:serine/threonine protein kinase